ncbi:MAG TPA: sigma 54-interacting transcriptional regulator [Candidatus Eisenbacteria bacterium]|jgi:transcriptional regulator with PAS, ATPase and Fis domain
MNEPNRHGIVGGSHQIQQLLQLLEQVAGTHSTVLIRGETGSGKELIARAVHRSSPRAAQPFVVVDCAALHENLLQSELFGHERGAYTGAVGLKHGLFEAAHRGTLFLDEIAELSPVLQVKLLRVLETGTFRRIGGMTDIHVDVRLVAATNRALEQMIADGDFREDLFYRVNVFPIEMPTLREHVEDIPLLVRHFLSGTSTPEAAVSAAAMQRLVSYRWPGNVRELMHVLERALILSAGTTIEPIHLPVHIQRDELPHAVVRANAALSLHEIELRHILRVLEENSGHRERAAAALGISERTLYRRLKENRAPHDDAREPDEPHAPGRPMEPLGA